MEDPTEDRLAYYRGLKTSGGRAHERVIIIKSCYTQGQPVCRRAGRLRWRQKVTGLRL